METNEALKDNGLMYASKYGKLMGLFDILDAYANAATHDTHEFVINRLKEACKRAKEVAGE